MKSKLQNEQSAQPVFDNAAKMLAAFKSRNPEWASSYWFNDFKCRGKCECDKVCLWIENRLLNSDCPLYQRVMKICAEDNTVPVTEFNDWLDYWDKLQISERIMNMIIETKLSDYEVQTPENYLNVREMAEKSASSSRTIIKKIRQGKLWARQGKIRTNTLGYVSTIEDFDNYIEYGLSKGYDPDYPNDVQI
jgi:hypothetical protein